MRADCFEAVRQNELRERTAVLKGVAADGGDAARERDARKRTAFPERTVTDGRDGVSAEHIRHGQFGSAARVCGDDRLAADDGIGKIALAKRHGSGRCQAQQNKRREQSKPFLHCRSPPLILPVIIIALTGRRGKGGDAKGIKKDRAS